MANLRALITDLRPAALDELGLAAALESLAERAANQLDVEVELDVDLAYERGEAPGRLSQEVESVAYRVVQEALTNVSKHAGAERAEVHVHEASGAVEIRVVDSGRGFASSERGEGFGLVGHAGARRARPRQPRAALGPRSGNDDHGEDPGPPCCASTFGGIVRLSWPRIFSSSTPISSPAHSFATQATAWRRAARAA